mmetsp:Transcript_26829/g.49332  ORF Transcript_26829/g.49332 Transcript_26829/m.49332 type:complete len:420 (+) Transcript_26829:96-1355(+)
MTTTHHRRRHSILAFLAAVAVAGSLLFAATNNNNQQYSSSTLRNNSMEASPNNLHPNRRRLASLDLAQFTDPKSVTLRSDAPLEAPLTTPLEKKILSQRPKGERPREEFAPVDHESRKKCQIIYILGVEGATHHGFIPIIEALARNQVDPTTGLKFDVDTAPSALKAGLFGWFYKTKIRKWGFKTTPKVDDPAFVQTVVRESCPDDGKKHVLIEWASFPSGPEDDRRAYRVKRQHEWMDMSPEEVANSDEALSHPTSMNAFYQAYSPFVDIKFVVLHRPFLETIASHRDWDGGPENHSNVIRGFMLMLRRFLDTHLYDLVTGSRLWSLVCVERIMAKNYDNDDEVAEARGHVISNLANFLGWPNGDCPHCFDDWRESTKDPLEVLGEKNVPILREHMKWLEGVWPPPGEEGVAEQQCGI